MTEIIRARKEHIPQIIEVWKEFIQFHIDTEPLWHPGRNAADGFEKQLKKQLKSSDVLVLAVLERNRVIGFAVAAIGGRPLVFRLSKWGTISDISVKNEYRHRGIGERMLTEIMEWFSLNKVALVEVSVLARNQVAASFWAKHGFQDFSRRMYRLTNPSAEC